MEKSENKKRIAIFEISIWNLFVYFIIFCVFGFLIETVYAFLTKGVIESRKGFMYGPFCPIYGLAGVVLVIFLKHFQKNSFTLFLGGFAIGSVVEYLISYVCEVLFNVKWWDYSHMAFNINGRICLIYSTFWGLLSIPFMKVVYLHLQNLTDYLEKKIGSTSYHKIVAVCMAFMMLDCFITIMALRVFSDRLVYTYNIEVANKEKVIEEYKNIISNKKLKAITLNVFSDEKMLRTFPNLTITKQDGTRVYVKTFVTSITPYYYKLEFGESFPHKLSKLKEKIVNICFSN